MLIRRRFSIFAATVLVVIGVLIGTLWSHPRPTFAASYSGYDVKKDFGAVGNGVADDTAKIQKAINAAQKSGGGVVFFPPGRYLVSSTLLVSGNNVQLEGAGKGTAIFLNKPTNAVIKIGHPSDLNQTTNNKVKNLSIDRSVSPDPNYTENISYGILVERARFTTLEGIVLYNATYGIAVGVRGGTGIPNQFTNIFNSYAMSSGSIIGNSTFPGANIVFWQGADHKISNVSLEPTHVGIQMADKSNAILIENTTVVSGGDYDYGIISEGNGFARYIDNCIIENARVQEIYIAGSSHGVTVANSWIGAGDVNPSAIRNGIMIEPTTSKVTIANNRIGNQRGIGILSKGSDVLIEGNILEENVNSRCACDSIQVEGGQHVTIIGNRISSSTDRYGIGLYGSLNNYIATNNNTSGSGAGINNAARGRNFIVNNNL